MIASLPMYETDRNLAAHDRFWSAIRAAYPGPLPPALTRDTDVWRMWQSPDLILSQTCGLPFRTRLRGRVALVGTPDYGLPDAPPGYYYSVMVVRADDARSQLDSFENAIWAVNDRLSQSGWAAPLAYLAASGQPSVKRAVLTGSHRASADAVIKERADIAAIDAVTWRLFQHEQSAEQLRVIARTAATPGLPLVTAAEDAASALSLAVRKAIETLEPEDKSALGGLRDLTVVSESAYLALAMPAELPTE